MRLARASISPSECSATAWAFRPGVLTTATPLAVAASISTWFVEALQIPTNFRFGAASNTSWNTKSNSITRTKALRSFSLAASSLGSCRRLDFIQLSHSTWSLPLRRCTSRSANGARNNPRGCPSDSTDRITIAVRCHVGLGRISSSSVGADGPSSPLLHVCSVTQSEMEQISSAYSLSMDKARSSRKRIVLHLHNCGTSAATLVASSPSAACPTTSNSHDLQDDPHN